MKGGGFSEGVGAGHGAWRLLAGCGGDATPPAEGWIAIKRPRLPGGRALLLLLLRPECWALEHASSAALLHAPSINAGRPALIALSSAQWALLEPLTNAIEPAGPSAPLASGTA